MALGKCPECGKEVSMQAPACPHCGVVYRATTPPKKGGGIMGAIKNIILIFVLVFVVIPVTYCTYKMGKVQETASGHASGSGAPTDVPPLEVQSWRCETESSYMFVRGEVKNVSSTPLKNVEAVGIFRDAAGTLIKSEDALIEYNPIMPGQTSPFRVGTTHNPLMKSCNLDFKDLLGGAIAFRSK